MTEELTNEQLLLKATAEGYLRFTGEGKNERIVYVQSKEHSERWSDPEEKVRALRFPAQDGRDEGRISGADSRAL